VVVFVRRTVTTVLSSCALIAFALPLAGQSLSVLSGNGQIVLEQFITTKPMTVRVVDNQNRPLAGTPIQWSITSGQGTLRSPAAIEVGGPSPNITDANGIAKIYFLATNVTPGTSIEQSTIRADSAFGSATFYVTTALVRLPGGGGFAGPPLVELVRPTLENNAFTGDAGTAINGAIVVRVTTQSGIDAGRPVPNVGVRIVNRENLDATPPASCRGTNGTVLTDSLGIANCDLILNTQTPLTRLAMMVGEAQITPIFTVTINPPTPCVYTFTPNSQNFLPAGGPGSFSITTAANCTWTVQSNSGWVLPTGATSGTGPGTINFNVLQNTVATARTGALSVGSTFFTVIQAAAGSTGVLSINAPNPLPNGVAGQFYNYRLQAAGGREPYVWSAVNLPPGISLDSVGNLIGTPNQTSVYNFSVSLSDSAGNSTSKNFQLTVGTTGTAQDPAITTSTFASGAVNAPYQQIVNWSGCVNLITGARFEVTNGALPPGLTLQQIADKWAVGGTPTQAGSFGFTLKVTDACGRSSFSSFTITVSGQSNPGGGPIVSDPATLNFTVFAGSLIRPPDQSIIISSPGQTLNYFVVVENAGSTPWLVLGQNSSGSTPASLLIGVNNFQSLLPGAYGASILISSTTGAQTRVPVVLNVQSLPNLTPSITSLAFSAIENPNVLSQPLTQIFTVTGTSGTAFNVAVRTDNGQNWLAVSPSTGVVPAALQVTVNYRGLEPRQYTGRIEIQSQGATVATIPVSLTVNNAPRFTWSTSGLSFVVSSTDPSPQPQRITLATTSVPIPANVAANTASGGNWLKVTPVSGTTPLELSVSVDPAGLQAGHYIGEIVARSADPTVLLLPQPIRVDLAITDTTPVITSVVNAASGQAGPLAPGSWATIIGGFLGSTVNQTIWKATNGVVDTTLTDVRFLVDGSPAPVIAASTQRAVIQMPYAIAGRDRVSIVAEYRGNRSQPVMVPVILVSPAIFLIEGTLGWVVNEDGTANRIGNGADIGSIVTVYATGEGLTDPAGTDGLLAGNNPPKPPGTVRLWMDGQEAEVISYGGVNGQPPGLFQVRARIPANVTRGGAVNMTLGINDNFSPDTVTIAIRQAPNQ
jgi:uncharacterized protein (TIGR03437 family)